ncbi:MAG: hypothetical protein M1469_00285 [Bacteroidetes bacterium]|nr:hypothetical protein [Bacteroidota bacterium]
MPSRQMFSANQSFIERVRTGVAYLVTIGFISILGQVVVLRELNVAFYGIELIYILAIGFWLFGTAIGAAVGRRSSVPAEKHIDVLLLVTVAVLIIDVGFIRGVRNIFGVVVGGYLPFIKQIIGLAIALLPLSIMSGLLFQWCAKRFVSESQSLAKAYAIESAGGVLGGLSSTLFFSFGLQNFSAALICTGAAVGIVTLAATRAERLSGDLKDSRTEPQETPRHGVLKILSMGGLICVVILLAASPYIDRWMTSWNHTGLVETRDTPYSRVTVTTQEGQVCVFEDDALAYETQSISAEEFVQLSTLQLDKPKRVLLLGGGFEGIILELLKLPVKKIEYIEINRKIIETVRRHLPREIGSSLADQRVDIIYEDPRQFLHRRRLYDMILVAMPEPMSAQNNRFYTSEFFDECSMMLDKDGVLAFEIKSAENMWTPQMQARNASIYCALKSVFNSIVVLPGVTNIFIASESTLTTDPARLAERFKERAIRTRLVSPQYINYLYTNDRFVGVNKMLSAGSPVPNSDLHPACYGYTMSIWLSKFSNDFKLPAPHALTITDLAGSVFFWLMLVIVLIISVGRKLAAARRFALVMLAGLTGMVTETLLLLNYQSKSGVLYQDIGILLMSFMIGLTLGAFLTDRFMHSIFYQEKSSPQNNYLMILSGVTLLICFTLLNVATYFLLRLEFLHSLYSTSLVLVLDGAFVSATFAFAAIRETKDRRVTPIRLYSADLIGGSVGSLIASFLLIPVYGILATSIIMAAVALYRMPGSPYIRLVRGMLCNGKR